MSTRVNRLSNKKRQTKLPQFTSRDKSRLFGVVMFLVATGALLAWLSHGSSGTQKDETVPPFLDAAQAAGPLPSTLGPTHFTDASVREAYAVASKIPGVLAQQPCYCWCSHIGHRSLLDCYRSEHAATCDICIKEALLASRMNEAGKTVNEIRTAIIAGEWSRLK